MRRPRILLAVFLTLATAASLALSALPAGAKGGGRLVRLVVKTDPGSAPSAAKLARAGAVDVQSLRYTPDATVVVAPARAAGKIAALRGVSAVERDKVMRIVHHRDGHGGGPGGGGDDSGGGSSQPPEEVPWGISKIQADQAWDQSNETNVDVCVTDTGADRDHPDLAANIEDGQNFTGGGRFGNNVKPDDWDDGNGHGTHVAGTVAALNNTIGVVGVGPDVDLLIAKVLSDSGSGWTSQIADGLNWCGTVGAEVVNMSWGGGSSSIIHDALKSLAAENTVLVAASGNDGGSLPIYPARHPEVIAVGATNSNDQVASWSNNGEEVNAPGVGVKSTVPNDSYDTFSGTSMASPHAAGTAALIIGDGTTSASNVRSKLSSTADSIGGGNLRINAQRAVA